MNRISHIRQMAGVELEDLARMAGIDVMEAALIENGLCLAHIHVVQAIADSLECTPEDLYPEAAQHLAALDAYDSSGDALDAMLAPERAETLRAAGIDPDLRAWYAIFSLKSGSERRYRVDSATKDGIRKELMRGAGGEWLIFTADCRNVLVRKRAIRDVAFRNDVSYAAFSSRESAYTLLMVSSRSARPEEFNVPPDGEEHRPLSEFIISARDGEVGPSFICVSDDESDEEVLIGVGDAELVEIPAGLIVPELYSGEPLPVESQADLPLEKMVIMGEA